MRNRASFMLALATLVAAVCAGCASTEQFTRLPASFDEAPPEGHARIYVFRPAMMGAAESARISDNGESVGNLGAGRFLCWERPASFVSVSAEFPDYVMFSKAYKEFVPDEGQSYYFVLQFPPFGGTLALREISPLEAEKRLKTTKPPNAASN